MLRCNCSLTSCVCVENLHSKVFCLAMHGSMYLKRKNKQTSATRANTVVFLACSLLMNLFFFFFYIFITHICTLHEPTLVRVISNIKPQRIRLKAWESDCILWFPVVLSPKKGQQAMNSLCITTSKWFLFILSGLTVRLSCRLPWRIIDIQPFFLNMWSSMNKYFFHAECILDCAPQTKHTKKSTTK